MMLQILCNTGINEEVQCVSLKMESESSFVQALNQDLLNVSVRLDTLEEQLQSSSSVRQTGGVTIEELEKERDALKKRRDTMDAQLKDNTVLTVEVRKKGACVCDSRCAVVRPFCIVHRCASCFFCAI